MRRVQPLVELRTLFTLERAEIDAVERGAPDADWDPVVDAARRAALAEDRVVFRGFPGRGCRASSPTSPHAPVTIDDRLRPLPDHVAHAVETLKRAGVAGPTPSPWGRAATPA